MSYKRSISTYTPSNTDPETRERVFVQRHKLLARVVRWCEESMMTGNKHHLLFVGPRGSGKTHLVAMVHHRLSKNPKLANKMRVAWLGEDNVFTGLIDLALEIADELSNEYPAEFGFDYRGRSRSLSADEAAELILDRIVSNLGDKSILLIIENLNRAFAGLGDLGQKKWRAFLQEHGRVATLATSQQLFEDISSRDAAFYGFFEIVHLEPLSVDDARELIAKIARENDKHELVQFLETPEGRYRVQALHHLAGGNHRIYVVLSEFLTKESLDGLVASFEELADDLTPYYQERVRLISPQQARIVQSLCNATGAMTVKQVSEDAFISDRNVSRQLGELKQRGYVTSEKRGKESLYEMAEPLMRLCLEVKKQRGKPLRLVAAFLRAWYSDSSLKRELEGESGISANNARRLVYTKTALQTGNAFHHGESEKEIADYSAVIEMKEAPVDQRAMALVNRGIASWQSEQFEISLNDFTAVTEMNGVSSSTRTIALFYIPEAMIPIKSLPESVESLRRAFVEGDPETRGYGGTPRDILRMIIGREPHSWAGFVEALVPIYAEYGALSTLGSGLTQSITALDSSEYSESQLDWWNSGWQRFGAEFDELSIALSALNAAIQVIKSGNDRPLFILPSEIREIVRPLLKNTLRTK